MLLGDLGRTSVGSYYELAMNGELYAEGAAKIVWVDPATGRPVPLPAVVPRRCARSRVPLRRRGPANERARRDEPDAGGGGARMGDLA